MCPVQPILKIKVKIRWSVVTLLTDKQTGKQTNKGQSEIAYCDYDRDDNGNGEDFIRTHTIYIHRPQKVYEH